MTSYTRTETVMCLDTRCEWVETETSDVRYVPSLETDFHSWASARTESSACGLCDPPAGQTAYPFALPVMQGGNTVHASTHHKARPDAYIRTSDSARSDWLCSPCIWLTNWSIWAWYGEYFDCSSWNSFFHLRKEDACELEHRDQWIQLQQITPFVCSDAILLTWWHHCSVLHSLSSAHQFRLSVARPVSRHTRCCSQTCP